MLDYNKIAIDYSEYNSFAKTDWKLGYIPVANLLEPIESQIILDYGCGDGKFSSYLAAYGAYVIAVDISLEMLKLAGIENVEIIKFELIKSAKLDFLEDNTINSAVLNFVLCTVSTRKRIIRILKEIHRVLADEGKIVILNANWEKSNGKNFYSFELEKSKGKLYSGKKVYVKLNTEPKLRLEDYYWSKDDYTSMLKESGFQIVGTSECIIDSDDIDWKDEKNSPPFCIILGKKVLDISNLNNV